MIVGAIESKNQIEDDSAEIARSASQTGHNPVVGRVHMRDHCKVGSISGLSKDGHYREGANQPVNVVGLNGSDANKNDTLDTGT